MRDRRERMWYTDSRAGGLREQICRTIRVQGSFRECSISEREGKTWHQ